MRGRRVRDQRDGLQIASGLLRPYFKTTHLEESACEVESQGPEGSGNRVWKQQLYVRTHHENPLGPLPGDRTNALEANVISKALLRSRKATHWDKREAGRGQV